MAFAPAAYIFGMILDLLKKASPLIPHLHATPNPNCPKIFPGKNQEDF
jgi:hypothetical protein